MQTSFVALKRVFLMPGSVAVGTGDILVFDASNNNSLTIYRDQKIVKTLTQSLVSLLGMETAGILKSIAPAAPAATPADDPISPVPTGKDDPISPVPTGKDDPISPVPTGKDDPISPVPTGNTETLSTVQKIEEELVVFELKTEVGIENAATAIAETAEKLGDALGGIFHKAVEKVEELTGEAEPEIQTEETKAESIPQEIATDLHNEEQKVVEKVETEAVKVEGEAKADVTKEAAKVEADAKSDVSAEVAKVEGAVATEVEKVATDVAQKLESDVDSAVSSAINATAPADAKKATTTAKAKKS